MPTDKPVSLAFAEFAARYCERQDSTPAELLTTLKRQKESFRLEGWLLLECHVLDSSRLGSYTVLPYGPDNTYKAPPDHPVSPRGLASDMSVVVALLPASEVP